MRQTVWESRAQTFGHSQATAAPAKLCRAVSSRRASPRGFTIIELMVVMGIVMVLIGLFLPSVAKVKGQAQATSRLSSVKHTTTLILAYTSDYKDIFPIIQPGGDPLEDSRYFYKPLINTGAIRTKKELDPIGWKHMRERGFNEIDILYSMSLVYEPELMVRGLTVPQSERKSRPVRLAEVFSPDRKGAVNVMQIFEGSRVGGWCCVPGAPRGPVGFLDGSAGEYFALELVPEGTFYHENGIGFAVHTTWSGVKGRDRQ